jgi:hypothetical protein
MNVNLLIDAIVRQTTVLIAQLATSAGARASLAPTANQVFLDLVRELKKQGLGNKLIADMFGLSPCTYHNKIRRSAESSTERGRPLWSAVLEFVQERATVSRADVLMHFARDDGATPCPPSQSVCGHSDDIAPTRNDPICAKPPMDGDVRSCTGMCGGAPA